MSTSDELQKAITILMETSYWGQASSPESLMEDFQKEVNEFITSLDMQNRDNSMEEAGDVFMMLLCYLYKTCELKSPDDIMERIIDKLHWRYAHLYKKEELQDSEGEFKRWEDAKKIEHKMHVAFCTNQNCSLFQKAGVGNISFVDGQYICSSCGKKNKPSCANTLLYRCANPEGYVKEVCGFLVEFNKGDESAPVKLWEKNATVSISFYNNFFNPDSKAFREEMKDIFIEYVDRKYLIPSTKAEEFLMLFAKEGIRLNKETVFERYCYEVDKNNSAALDLFSNREKTSIKKKMRSLKFGIKTKMERGIDFEARSWNHQTNRKYLLRYSDKEVLECMTLFHYKGNEAVDLTIELSNMYNCIVGCKFCASGSLPGKPIKLKGLDFVRQLNTCLQKSEEEELEKFGNFYVSFAGIGEPSYVYEEVAKGMIMIRDLYPQIEFNIATFGFRKECFKYWGNINLPIRTLQLPLYHITKDKIAEIVENIPNDYSWEEVLQEAIAYKAGHPLCRVKVNYIPMKGVNDSDETVKRIIDLLEPYKNEIDVKVSYLNETAAAKKNNLITPGKQRLDEIRSMLVNSGFSAYVFGTENHTGGLGCGELVQDYNSILVDA